MNSLIQRLSEYSDLEGGVVTFRHFLVDVLVIFLKTLLILK